MKGRLPTLVMVFVSLAVVISLVVALTPDASAQDSGTPPDGTANWLRHNIPAEPDLQADCCPNQLDGVTPRTCCITIIPGFQPIPDTTLIMPVPDETLPLPYVYGNRWFCVGGIQ